MNTTNTIFPNIGNNNKKCDNLMMDSSSKISSDISKSASATDQKASTLFILQDSKSRYEHHEIHGNQHHRNVNSTNPETYLTHRTASHDSLDDNIKRNTENISASREWPSCTETVKGFFTSLIPPMKEEPSKIFRWDPKPKVIATSLLNIYSPGFFFWTALFYALTSNAKVVEASSETNSPSPDTAELTNTAKENITTNSTDPLSKGVPIHNKIDINDITMLENIGVDDNFPLDGNYELTADLDGSSFTKPINIFKGDLNGMNHTISNIKYPLIEVIYNGKVRNLTINNSNFTENIHCLSSIVCSAKGSSIISNVHIKDSHLNDKVSYASRPIGVMVGTLSGSSMIENSSVKNCTITTNQRASWVGVLAGVMRQSPKSTNNTVDRISINTTLGGPASGCLFGSMQDNSLSSNDQVLHCSLTAHGDGSESGGTAGILYGNAKIRNVTVRESKFEANGKHSRIGVVLGSVSMREYEHASLSGSTAINSTAIATQKGSHAGIWVGIQMPKNFQLYNNTAINCTAEAPEPTMVVDGASYLSIGLLLTGVTVTYIGGACFAYSLYKGFQEGKRGRSLATHPFTSFGTFLTNRYRQCVSSFFSVGTTPEEDDIPLVDNRMTTSL